MGYSADVVVVGGGAAGLAAAYAARRRNASVLIVERDRVGGDCTWTGCVPSKTLVEVARRVAAARRLGFPGQADFGGVMERVAGVVADVARDEDRAALEAQGVTLVDGEASFTAPGRLSIDGTPVEVGAVVLATGSAPTVPAGLAPARPLTTDSLWDLRDLPDRLLVVGGGPVGAELGQALPDSGPP